MIDSVNSGVRGHGGARDSMVSKVLSRADITQLIKTRIKDNFYEQKRTPGRMSDAVGYGSSNGS